MAIPFFRRQSSSPDQAPKPAQRNFASRPMPRNLAPDSKAANKAATEAKGLFREKGSFGKFRLMPFYARNMKGRYVKGVEGMVREQQAKESLQRLEGYSKKLFQKNLSGLNEQQLGSIKDPYSLIGKLHRDELEKAKQEGRWNDFKQIKKDIAIYQHLKDEGF